MTDLIKWPGSSELERFKKEMDDLFERFFDWKPSRSSVGRDGWRPLIDLSETPKEIVLRADLPGIDKKEIELSLDGRYLTIRGKKKGDFEDTKENFHRVERKCGAFTRTLELPVDVDPSKVKATYKHGVLKLNLPKVRKNSAQKVEIRTV